MEYKIEKGIAVPPRGRPRGVTAFLRSFEVGDSALLQIKSLTGFSGSLKPMKFCGRKQPDGYRVWRIA